MLIMISIVSKLSSMIAFATHITFLLFPPPLKITTSTMSFLLPASSVAFSFHSIAARRRSIHHHNFEDCWRSHRLYGRRGRSCISNMIFGDDGCLQSSLSDDEVNAVDGEEVGPKINYSPPYTSANTSPSEEGSSQNLSPAPSSSSAHRRKSEIPQQPPDPSTFPSWSYEPRDFFRFEILYESKKSLARVGRIHTVRIMLQRAVPLFVFIFDLM